MPSRSRSQQRLFGMLHAYNKGELRGNISASLEKKLREMSEHMSDEDAEHFARTPHKKLPERITKEKKAEEMNFIQRCALDRIVGMGKIAVATTASALPATTTMPIDPAVTNNMYTVTKGDTLSGIALRHKTTVDELARLNGIKNPDTIRAGYALKLPVANTANTANTANPTSTANTVTSVRSRPRTVEEIRKAIRPLGTYTAVPIVPNTDAGQAADPEVDIEKLTPAQRRHNYVAKVLHDYFHNPAFEAGALANIARETGDSFYYRQWEGNKKEDFDTSKKQTGGYGLFQFTGPSQESYKEWLVSNNAADSVTNQIRFMKESYGPTRLGWRKNVNFRTPKAPKDSKQYADWFYRRVETPAHTIPTNKAYSKADMAAAKARHEAFIDRLTPASYGWVWK